MTHQRTRFPRQRVRPKDLAAEQVTELPERAALSVLNASVAAPVCAALGLNVASDSSAAIAVAYQHAPVYQHN